MDGPAALHSVFYRKVFGQALVGAFDGYGVVFARVVERDRFRLAERVEGFPIQIKASAPI